MSDVLFTNQLRSNISVQDGVSQIDKRLDELVEAMKKVGMQGYSGYA